MGDSCYHLVDALGMDLYDIECKLEGKAEVFVESTPVTFKMEVIVGADRASVETAALLRVKGKLYLFGSATESKSGKPVLHMSFISADKLGSILTKTTLSNVKNSAEARKLLAKGIVADFKYNHTSATWEKLAC
jgi:hypothetical protein